MARRGRGRKRAAVVVNFIAIIYQLLKDLIADNPEPAQNRNLVREYLQARILESLQRSGAMIPLAFHGGTALRFLYRISRFSEDLDFALERPSATYDFRAYLKAIQSEFKAEGYDVEVKVNDQKIGHSAFVRFYGLVYYLKLSSQSNEALSVKSRSRLTRQPEQDSRPMW